MPCITSGRSRRRRATAEPRGQRLGASLQTVQDAPKALREQRSRRIPNSAPRQLLPRTRLSQGRRRRRRLRRRIRDDALEFLFSYAVAPTLLTNSVVQLKTLRSIAVAQCRTRVHPGVDGSHLWIDGSHLWRKPCTTSQCPTSVSSLGFTGARVGWTPYDECTDGKHALKRIDLVKAAMITSVSIGSQPCS